MKLVNELKKILTITQKESIVKPTKDLKIIIERHGNKPNIINAGLLKAGKSSLFNALSGKEEFEIGTVRTTVENKSIDVGKYILTDTPGFDANEQDDKTAFEGYKAADYIIFVHNVMEGEFNKIEIEQIDRISKLYKNNEDLFEASILVLSFSDQVENEVVENTLSLINNQMEKLFNCKFKNSVAISSSIYIKGINENKEGLIKISNFNKLENLIDQYIQEVDKNSLFEKYVTKQIENIHNIIKIEIEREQNELKDKNDVESNIKKTENIKTNIDMKIQNVIESIEKKIPENGNFKNANFVATTNSYTEYRSSSSARSAATEACQAAIKSAAAATRNVALNAVAYYENFIHIDGGLGNVKKVLLEGYNEIKQMYYSVVNDSKMSNFNINIPNKVEENKFQIECAYDIAKYIGLETFRSANSYLTSYDANCYIDEDYRTEYVSGFFGSREKEVKYYTWDIKGAVDDIQDSVREILQDRVNSAYDIFNKIYVECVNEMIEQYKLLFNEINSLIDKRILEQKQNNNKKVEDDKKKVQYIENLKDVLENLENDFK